MILDSRIGALDRTLGFAFGAARGLLLAVVGFLFFSWLAQDEKNHPVWVRDAKLKPMLVSAGATLKSMLPTIPTKRCASCAASRWTAKRHARPFPNSRPSAEPRRPLRLPLSRATRHRRIAQRCSA